jgi:hypothetical protein
MVVFFNIDSSILNSLFKKKTYIIMKRCTNSYKISKGHSMKNKHFIFSFLLFIIGILPQVAASQNICDGLWYERNKIFAEKGLCFGSPYGMSLFDTYPCITYNGSALTLTYSEGQRVQKIIQQEAQNQCNVPMEFTAPQALIVKAYQERGMKNFNEPGSEWNTQQTETPIEPEAIPQAELEPEPSQNSQQIVLAVGETGLSCTGNGDVTKIYNIPDVNSNVIAVLTNGTSLKVEEIFNEDDVSQIWYKASGKTDTGTTYDGYVKNNLLAPTCDVLHSFNVSNLQESQYYFTNVDLDEIRTDREIGNFPEADENVNIETQTANTAMQMFFWSRPDCGPPPVFSFTQDAVKSYTSQSNTYEYCLSVQVIQDERDFKAFTKTLGGQSETPSWTPETILRFPWSCSTCQAHYQSIANQKQNREIDRKNDTTQHEKTFASFKSWVYLNGLQEMIEQ